MKLKEWLRRKGMHRNEIADLLGARSQTVQYWMDGHSTPGLLFAMRLKKITKGKVSFEEMLDPRKLKKWEMYDGSKKHEKRSK